MYVVKALGSRGFISLVALYLALTTIGIIIVGHKHQNSGRKQHYTAPVAAQQLPSRQDLVVESSEASTNGTSDNDLTGRQEFPNVKIKYSTVESYAVKKMKCPEVSENLVGRMQVNTQDAIWRFQNESSSSKNDEERFAKEEKFLGTPIDSTNASDSLCQKQLTTIYEPKHCEAIHSVAVLIPCRDREKHLKIILGHLHPVLRKQLLRYAIFVITQDGNDTFNKARLLNTGFEFASRIGRSTGRPFNCFIFQDIDMLTENDMNIHKCPQEKNEMYHLSTTINKYDYVYMPGPITVGGVLGMREDQFRKVNGYSNEYWGWGGEDDDLNMRIAEASITIKRPTAEVGRYTMLKHERDARNPNAKDRVEKNLLDAKKRYHTDGLSNLKTRITSVTWMPLYTFVSVDVGLPPSDWSKPKSPTTDGQ